MKKIVALLFVLCTSSIEAQVTLSPIPQGFVGNSSASSAPPAAITPQQAATMVQPYITGGGSSGPWINAANPGNGCGGVVPGQDAVVALQCQIDALFNAPGAGLVPGGIIQIPPGTYPLSATLVIKGGVTLWGSGARATMLQTAGDYTAIKMEYNVAYGGFRDLWVRCYENSAAVNNCVRVEQNVPAILRDSWIWGGYWALDTAGVDGFYEHLYINGWGTNGGSIKSTGANWYVRIKANSWPQATNVGFYQGVTGGTYGQVAENHITQSDFSGPYQLSIYVADGAMNTSVLIISDSVFSAPVSIPNHHTTIFKGNEFGSTFLYNGTGQMILTGNVFFGSTTMQGPGIRACAANIGLSC